MPIEVAVARRRTCDAQNDKKLSWCWQRARRV